MHKPHHSRTHSAFHGHHAHHSRSNTTTAHAHHTRSHTSFNKPHRHHLRSNSSFQVSHANKLWTHSAIHWTHPQHPRTRPHSSTSGPQSPHCIRIHSSTLSGRSFHEAHRRSILLCCFRPPLPILFLPRGLWFNSGLALCGDRHSGVTSGPHQRTPSARQKHLLIGWHIHHWRTAMTSRHRAPTVVWHWPAMSWMRTTVARHVGATRTHWTTMGMHGHVKFGQRTTLTLKTRH